MQRFPDRRTGARYPQRVSGAGGVGDPAAATFAATDAYRARRSGVSQRLSQAVWPPPGRLRSVVMSRTAVVSDAGGKKSLCSIRICSYLLLPLIYLLVNVKIAQLGKVFPLPSSLYRCAAAVICERISVPMIASSIGAGLRHFLTSCSGQSLNAVVNMSPSTMLFCLYCGHYRDGLISDSKPFSARITTERFCVFYLGGGYGGRASPRLRDGANYPYRRSSIMEAN